MANEREERLTRILDMLLSEQSEYSALAIPVSLAGQQKLMRALLNVRPPRPVSREFLELQDEELQEQLRDKGTVCPEKLPACRRDGRYRIWQGDITRLKVDAVTNAANSRLLGCFVPLHGCIDNAIHSAAGVQLRLECHRIMEEQGHPEPTGRAKITPGYNLPSSYVLHTVGPIIPDGKPTQEQRALLADCYTSCLELADSRGLHSLAFCCISTGEFRFPRRLAAETALHAADDYFRKHGDSGISTVIFNVFKDEDYRIYSELLG